MASKIEILNRKIERLKELNQSLVKSCQQMEVEMFEMREQQNIIILYRSVHKHPQNFLT